MNTSLANLQNNMSQTKSTHAVLQEIFSSIQGEAVYVGRRQIFVRFNACHLHCAYCDSLPHPAADPCAVETISGSGEIRQIENPVPVETALSWIRHFHNAAKHHSVSFTGGEPLLYTDYLKNLLPDVQKLLPVYLETSGTQPDRLADRGSLQNHFKRYLEGSEL